MQFGEQEYQNQHICMTNHRHCYMILLVVTREAMESPDSKTQRKILVDVEKHDFFGSKFEFYPHKRKRCILFSMVHGAYEMAVYKSAIQMQLNFNHITNKKISFLYNNGFTVCKGLFYNRAPIPQRLIPMSVLAHGVLRLLLFRKLSPVSCVW